MTRRTKLLSGTGLVLVLLVAAGAWLGIRAMKARDALTDARASLAAARVALLDQQIPVAQDAIAQAGRDTERARSLTGDPLWRLAGLVPVAGNSFDTARGLSIAADELARDVLPQALTSVQSLDPATLRDSDGAIDVAKIKQVTPALTGAAERTAQVRRDVEDLPDSALVGSVADARTELLDQLVALTSAVDAGSEALQVAPALLGDDKPRRYLVLIQQPGEARGTGGLIGGYAQILVSKGKVTAERTGSNDDLRREFTIKVPEGVPQDWLDLFTTQGSLGLWQNVNVSANLPVVSRLITARWEQQGGQPIDGVVMLDPQGVSSILAGSGPIALGDGRTLTPEQLPEYFAVGQYVGFEASTAQKGRKENLDVVARAAITRVTAGGGDSTALLRGLTTAIRTGHLHMASDDPALAPVLSRTGLDMPLPQGEAPVAYPVVFNASGGKLESWLFRELRYEAGSCDGDRRRSTITTTLTGKPPPGLPPYVTLRLVDGVQTSSTTGRVGLMVYGTRGATLVSATLDGKPVPQGTMEVGTEDGMPVWTVYLDTPPETPRVFALELDEPTAKGEARVPQQPMVRDLVKDVQVPTC